MANISEEKRKKIMASIPSRNTKPELIVRHYLWREGFRYRINLNKLPGHPDIVLYKYRTCIFVNGCFWHGHNCSEFRRPKSNVDYWMAKINRNKERDDYEQLKLAKLGWHVIIIWECQLKPLIRKATLQSLSFTLNHIFLIDSKNKYLNTTKKNE